MRKRALLFVTLMVAAFPLCCVAVECSKDASSISLRFAPEKTALAADGFTRFVSAEVVNFVVAVPLKHEVLLLPESEPTIESGAPLFLESVHLLNISSRGAAVQDQAFPLVSSVERSGETMCDHLYSVPIPVQELFSRMSLEKKEKDGSRVFMGVLWVTVLPLVAAGEQQSLVPFALPFRVLLPAKQAVQIRPVSDVARSSVVLASLSSLSIPRTSTRRFPTTNLSSSALLTVLFAAVALTAALGVMRLNLGRDLQTEGCDAPSMPVAASCCKDIRFRKNGFLVPCRDLPLDRPDSPAPVLFTVVVTPP